jgi:hypothetical protein
MREQFLGLLVGLTNSSVGPQRTGRHRQEGIPAPGCRLPGGSGIGKPMSRMGQECHNLNAVAGIRVFRRAWQNRATTGPPDRGLLILLGSSFLGQTRPPSGQVRASASDRAVVVAAPVRLR